MLKILLHCAAESHGNSSVSILYWSRPTRWPTTAPLALRPESTIVATVGFTSTDFLSALGILRCRTGASFYSITSWIKSIHDFSFFCMTNRHVILLPFCGLCPHPASGIRLGYYGNNINADGTRLGWQVLGYCHPDLSTNDP